MISLLISVYFAGYIFAAISDKISFALAGFLSGSVAAIFDGIIMGTFFFVSSNLPYTRILDIFVREMSYKALYVLLAHSFIMILLATIEYVLKKERYDIHS